jgi:hypothetical protein
MSTYRPLFEDMKDTADCLQHLDGFIRGFPQDHLTAMDICWVGDHWLISIKTTGPGEPLAHRSGEEVVDIGELVRRLKE